MADLGKYDINDPLFDEKHGVLKNKLGIINRDELETAEKQTLISAYKEAALEYSSTHAFTEKDVKHLHKLFLGEIYQWAGEYRTVDLSSSEIRFCHAAYIEKNMKVYSEDLSGISPFTPDLAKKDILSRLAIIHGELIIIHPFRDGNGRTTRLLCDLLLMQAEYKPMRAGSFYSESFVQQDHKAIQHVWHAKDYSVLADFFEPLISR